MSFCFYRIWYLLIRLLKKPLPTPHILPDPISFDPDNRTIPL